MQTINGKKVEEFTPRTVSRARRAVSRYLDRDITQTEFAKMLGYSLTGELDVQTLRDRYPIVPDTGG